MNQLGKSFEDSSKKETVIQRLRQLKQGFKSVNVFFQQFEILKTKAGLKNEVHNTVLIDLLQYSLNTEVLRQLIHIYSVFTTYKDWKGYAIQINNNETCLRKALNCKGLSGNHQKGQLYFQLLSKPQNPKPDTPLAQNSVYTVTLHSFKSTPSGKVYLRVGELINITINNTKRNKACYICKEISHFARTCPSQY